MYVVRDKIFSEWRGTEMYRSGCSQIITVRTSCKITLLIRCTVGKWRRYGRQLVYAAEDTIWVFHPQFFKFDVRKSVHHHTIQINQPTRCNSFTSLLFDVYVWLNMFRAPLRLSSEAYNCTRSLWFYRWSVVVGALLVVCCRPRPTTPQPPRSNGKTKDV